MEKMESPAKQQEESQLQFTPLMISLIGIMSTAFALVLYHFIFTTYWRRAIISHQHHRRQSQRPLPIAGAGPQQQVEATGGVDDKVLQSIPALVYSSFQTNNNHNQQGGYGYGGWLFRGGDESECAVCLGELEEGDMVRLLPTCRHAFHLVCIDHWFLSHSTCPLCRSLAVGPPGEHVLTFSNIPTSSSSSSSSTTYPSNTPGIHEKDHNIILETSTATPMLMI